VKEYIQYLIEQGKKRKTKNKDDVNVCE